MKSRFSQEEKNSIITQYWSGDTAPAVCEQYGISSSTLYSWIKDLERIEDGAKPTADQYLKKQYSDLKRHAGKMEQKAYADTQAPFHSVDRGEHKVRVLFKASGHSECGSGFYC